MYYRTRVSLFLYACACHSPLPKKRIVTFTIEPPQDLQAVPAFVQVRRDTFRVIHLPKVDPRVRLAELRHRRHGRGVVGEMPVVGNEHVPQRGKCREKVLEVDRFGVRAVHGGALPSLCTRRLDRDTRGHSTMSVRCWTTHILRGVEEIVHRECARVPGHSNAGGSTRLEHVHKNVFHL